MSRSEAFRALFTQTEAKVVIPAAKNLYIMTQKYDEAVTMLYNMKETELNFVEVDRPEPKLVIACAEQLVNSIMVERARMEGEFINLLDKCIKRTKTFQKENLDCEIFEDPEAYSIIIRNVENLKANYMFDIDYISETLDECIIKAIASGLVCCDCMPFFYYCSEDDEFDDDDVEVYDDDDNRYVSSTDVEAAIASIEEYLEGLRERAEQLRKDEAKNKAK